VVVVHLLEVASVNRSIDLLHMLSRKFKQLSMIVSVHHIVGVISNRLALSKFFEINHKHMNFFDSSPTPPSSKAKGMQLGRKQKGADLFEAVKNEVGFEEVSEKPNFRGTSVSKVQTERF
jgi:hypothetical protein